MEPEFGKWFFGQPTNYDEEALPALKLVQTSMQSSLPTLAAPTIKRTAAAIEMAIFQKAISASKTVRTSSAQIRNLALSRMGNRYHSLEAVRPQVIG